MEGRAYGSIDEKVKDVDDCLSRLESKPERVKSLVRRKWIKRNQGAVSRLRGLIRLKQYNVGL